MSHVVPAYLAQICCQVYVATMTCMWYMSECLGRTHQSVPVVLHGLACKASNTIRLQGVPSFQHMLTLPVMHSYTLISLFAECRDAIRLLSKIWSDQATTAGLGSAHVHRLRPFTLKLVQVICCCLHDCASARWPKSSLVQDCNEAAERDVKYRVTSAVLSAVSLHGH